MSTNMIFQTTLIMIPLIAMGVVFRAVQKGSYLAYDTLDRWQGTRIQDVKYRNQTILTATLATEALKGVVGLTRLFVIVVTLAIYIPLIFNLFPKTRWLSDMVFGVTIEQLSILWTGFVAYLPTLILLIVIGLIVRYIIKFIHLIFIEIEKGVIVIPGFDKGFAPLTYSLIRGIIIIITIAYMYSFVPGNKTPSIQVAVVLTTLLGGIGAKDIITDMISGIVLTYRRTFRMGDRIQINDIAGYVVEKSLLVTHIRTDNNEVISIPNATVLRNQITNHSYLSDRERFLTTRFSVGYDQPWPKIHKLLLAAAEATSGVLTDPPPLITQTSLDDFYSQYEFRVYIPFTDNPVTKSKVLNDLIQNIEDVFSEAGVSLSSPHLFDISS